MFRTPTETEPCAMNEASYKSDTSLLIRDLTSKSSTSMDRTRENIIRKQTTLG